MSGDLTTDNMPFVAKYEATVITGFESLAAEEVREKLNIDCRHSQGKINFETDADPKDILQLRSIDNVYVVLASRQLDELPQDNQEDLKNKLLDLLPDIKWEDGLNVWRKISSFSRCSVEDILSPGMDHRDVKPKFRATCYRSGSGHNFQSNEAAAMFGGIIDDQFKWPVSMKEFDLEVVLMIKDNTFEVCLALTKDSLHRRNLVSIGPTTLRATVCYNMLRLANIQEGDIVCDPLAGTGSILIESSVVNGGSVFNIAADNHPMAIHHSSNNVAAIEKDPSNGRIGVIQVDSTKMPFRTASVDVFISDMPFGKRIGTKTMNSVLYPKILYEMGRVARPSSSRAVLLTQDYKNMKSALRCENVFKCWRITRTVFLKLGNLVTHVYCLKRTAYKFSTDIG